MKLMLNGKEVTGMGHYVMAGDIKDATAEDSNVLSGKVYYNNNGKREGTMPNRGGMSAELAAGGSVSILEGYHNGEGVVRAQDLASQTAGTMTAETLSVGETGWVNGEQITGSLVVPEVNDWDPEEMEENVMLDLSGYSVYKNTTIKGKLGDFPAGTYIILTKFGGCILQDTEASGSPNLYLVFQSGVPFKIRLGTSKTLYAFSGANGATSTSNITFWKKDE